MRVAFGARGAAPAPPANLSVPAHSLRRCLVATCLLTCPHVCRCSSAARAKTRTATWGSPRRSAAADGSSELVAAATALLVCAGVCVRQRPCILCPCPCSSRGARAFARICARAHTLVNRSRGGMCRADSAPRHGQLLTVCLCGCLPPAMRRVQDGVCSAGDAVRGSCDSGSSGAATGKA